jgi:hypothetical protein
MMKQKAVMSKPTGIDGPQSIVDIQRLLVSGFVVRYHVAHLSILIEIYLMAHHLLWLDEDVQTPIYHNKQHQHQHQRQYRTIPSAPNTKTKRKGWITNSPMYNTSECTSKYN